MGDIEVKALDGVDLDIAKEEFIGIMGPSGSGKSTLLHMLGILDHPTTGKIHIDGVDIGKLTDYEKTMFRLYKLGYVFQDYALVPDLTVSENLRFFADLYNVIGEARRHDAHREATCRRNPAARHGAAVHALRELGQEDSICPRLR